MDLYDWLLALHVLAAFAGVAGLIVLWGLAVGTREPEPAIAGPTAAALGKWGGITVGVGLTVALVFGIWLAIDVEAYELWDGWILASLVLWLLGGWAGGKSGKEAVRGPEGRRGWLRYQALNTVAVLVILVLMIWKPGA